MFLPIAQLRLLRPKRELQPSVLCSNSELAMFQISSLNDGRRTEGEQIALLPLIASE